ncbi:MAG: YolD-like family protein [Bacilli bacterium]|nr:YolD-like family protein [Bacilli bacterium]
MSADRGMMKWMPYKSLIEQSTVLAKMLYEKRKTPRPLISSDRAEEINEILVHYDEEPIKAKYWEDGYLYYLDGTISKIDVINHALFIGEKRIAFPNLIDLQRV